MRPVRLVVATALLLFCVFLIACNAAPKRAGDPEAVPPQDASVEPLPVPSPVPKPAPQPTPPSTHHGRQSIAPEPGRGPASVVPTPTPPPPTDDQLLDTALSKLRKGNLAYSTPDKMKAGKTAHVVARIAGDTVSIETLQRDLPKEDSARIEVAATPISTKMKMTLKGADFDITPLSSEEQIVAGDTPTQWQWDIVPRHAGVLRLHLAAVVEINNLARDFTSVDRDIPVQVDPVDQVTGFISKNWQWLIATLTALVGAAWKYYTSRKNKAPATST